MRVLAVNDLPPGGASGTEVHLALLRDGLRAGGDDVEVFSRPARTGPPVLRDVWDPVARTALADAVRRVRPDVLHVHNVVRELSVSVLTAAPGVPLVLTAHDGRLLGDADGQGPLLRAAQRARAPLDRAVARRRADLVLAVSAALAERFRRAGFRSVVHAAPWAAPPVVPPTPPEQSYDLVLLGRLQRDKGARVLVDAFGRVAARHPRARLLLAGAGGHDLPAHPQVQRLGVLDRDAVSRLLATARAVVLPSLPGRRPEGSPLALVEGLVHGRPLVVSDDPGCAALARDGAAGLVAPAGDVAALAAALDRVLSDDGLVRGLAAGASRAAAEHLPEAGLRRVRDAYAAVLR